MLLFRRREVWLPTLWGWCVLVVVAALVAVVGAVNANRLLALDAPARGPGGAGARTLVVEGWMGEAELAQAVALFRRGRYERVLTTGGPIEAWSDVGGWKTFAQRGSAYLRAHGLAGVPVIAVPAPDAQRDRTYLEGVAVREWAQRTGVALGAIDLVSPGVHARRSRMVYRMALGDAVEVGVFATVPEGFDAERWWTSSRGVKSTIGESLSLAWTVCCFWPPAAPP